MLQAGKYGKRARFERPSTVVGEFGHRTPGWVLVAEAWVSIRPTGSNERLAAFQMQSGQTHVVGTPYGPALAAATGAWRMVHRGRVLAIVGLPRNVGERDELLEFDCKEVTNDGH